MRIEKQKTWNKLEETLSIPTKHCKICFKEIRNVSLYSFLNKENVICENCFAKFNPRFIHFQVNNIKGLSIYEYDSTIQELLFKFKGCFDIELKDVFLQRYINYLRIRYHGYYLVPLPSNKEDDEKRGFNHVVEIYNRLNLPMLKILEKVKHEKQAKKGKKARLNSRSTFQIIDKEIVRGKRILIADDVYTTGSSMNAAIELIKSGKPRKISILVIAKNIEGRKK